MDEIILSPKLVENILSPELDENSLSPRWMKLF